MSEPQFNALHAGFSIAFMRSLICWNNAEESARQILDNLSKGGIGARIAIYQLGNVSLGDALNTVAAFLETIDADLARRDAAHVRHFVEGLDRLRGYRNFYVHHLRALTVTEQNCEGVLYGVDVKKGYRWVSGTLTLKELVEFTQHCVNLDNYGKEIAAGISPLEEGSSVQDIAIRHSLSSLEKPSWPEILKKTRKNLIAPSHPPQPSQA